MKSPRLVLAALALTISVASFSQTDTTKKDTTTHKTDSTKKQNPSLAGIEKTNDGTQGLQANASQSNGQSEAPNTAKNSNAVINNASPAVVTSQKSRPNSGKP